MSVSNIIGHNVPSIFIIGTPFQALCAIEAIYEFDIVDFKFLLALDSSPRNEQLFKLLSKYNIQYEILCVDYTITKLDRIKAFIPRFNKYKNIYLGDSTNELLKFLAFRYGANGSKTIYLDDGTRTISYLEGRRNLGKKLSPYYFLLKLFRNIEFERIFFTVYSDIQNKKYKIVANNFSFFSKGLSEKRDHKNIFIVGTTTEKFYISPDKLINSMDELFSSLSNKHPMHKIVYVPHGRDNSKRWNDVCDKYGVAIVRPDESIEFYLMSLSYCPMEVYGYTSSALYNIKLLFPQCSIFNILFENENTPINYLFISEYYAKHGITKLSYK